MFDSEPKGREGEPIEIIVPEAISVTASKTRESDGHTWWQRSWLASLPEGKGAFAGAAVVAAVEALALIVVVVL